jgi:hypothetical protein
MAFGMARLTLFAGAAKEDRSISIRIHVVHPQNGGTGVFVIETGKPTMRVDSTPEEVQHVRADLEKHRARSRNAWLS